MNTKFQPGQKIMSSGYEGSVVRHYSETMWEIRLPGGLVCVSERDIIPCVSDERKAELTKLGYEIEDMQKANGDGWWNGHFRWFWFNPAKRDDYEFQDGDTSLSLEAAWIEADKHRKDKETVNAALNLLCDEFKQWVKDNNLPHLSADEYVFRDDIELTDEQHDFLSDFIKRWEAAEKIVTQ